MQSRDVTGWREQMADAKQLQDTEKIVVTMSDTLPRNSPPSRTHTSLVAAISPPREDNILPPLEMAITDKDLEKPTCSLNLICYRPGSQGCVLRQVRVLNRQRSKDNVELENSLKLDSDLIETDQDFFEAIRAEYSEHMCGFWRHYFSLKTLRHIRLLSVLHLLPDHDSLMYD
jgi:hypothetical protein